MKWKFLLFTALIFLYSISLDAKGGRGGSGRSRSGTTSNRSSYHESSNYHQESHTNTTVVRRSVGIYVGHGYGYHGYGYGGYGYGYGGHGYGYGGYGCTGHYQLVMHPGHWNFFGFWVPPYSTYEWVYCY